MKGDYLTLHNSRGRFLLKVAKFTNRLYKAHMLVDKPNCLQARICEDAWRWHARLGHINFDSIKLMVSKKMVYGIPKIEHVNEICESCLVGKQTRLPFPKASAFRSQQVLELIHGDLCGPLSPATLGGNKYIFVMVDDFSRYMWSLLLKEKSEAFEKFKTFKALVEKETGSTIKTFRTNRGGRIFVK